MKIGFLSLAHLGINSMLPGGGGITNLLIKRVLEEAGHKVDFLHYGDGGPLVPGRGRLAARLNRLIVLHAWRKARFVNSWAENYDVLICESSVCHRIKHPRCINLFHFIINGYLDCSGITPRSLTEFLKFFLFGLLEKVEARGKFNIAVSEFSKKILNSQGVEVFRVIPNAVDTELFTPLIGEENRSGCLHVGTFSYRKGFDILEKLAERSVRIDCVTDHETGVHNGLNYKGSALHEKMPGIYNRYKYLLFPSRNENCALVPIEAMACGVPVVMSNVGGAAEIRRSIPEFVVEGFDDAAVGEYLRRITLIEKNYGEFSQKAICYAREHHSLDRFRRDWVNLVEEIYER